MLLFFHLHFENSLWTEPLGIILVERLISDRHPFHMKVFLQKTFWDNMLCSQFLVWLSECTHTYFCKLLKCLSSEGPQTEVEVPVSQKGKMCAEFQVCSKLGMEDTALGKILLIYMVLFLCITDSFGLTVWNSKASGSQGKLMADIFCRGKESLMHCFRTTSLSLRAIHLLGSWFVGDANFLLQSNTGIRLHIPIF